MRKNGTLIGGYYQYALPGLWGGSVQGCSDSSASLFGRNVTISEEKGGSDSDQIEQAFFVQLCFYGVQYVGRISLPADAIIWGKLAEGWASCEAEPYSFFDVVEETSRGGGILLVPGISEE